MSLLRHIVFFFFITPCLFVLIESIVSDPFAYFLFRPWLEKYPLLLASVVYSYLRFIEDHFNPGLTTLRQKEISFIVPLLRDKFNECLVIGRDLVRLLQSVAKIPEFELLWKDILHNPKSLSPNFTGKSLSFILTYSGALILQCQE